MIVSAFHQSYSPDTSFSGIWKPLFRNVINKTRADLQGLWEGSSLTSVNDNYQTQMVLLHRPASHRHPHVLFLKLTPAFTNPLMFGFRGSEFSFTPVSQQS